MQKTIYTQLGALWEERLGGRKEEEVLRVCVVIVEVRPRICHRKKKKKTGANKSTKKSSGSPDHCPRGQHKTGVSARFVTDFRKKR